MVFFSINRFIVLGVFFAFFWNCFTSPDVWWSHVVGVSVCSALMGWIAWFWHRECKRAKNGAKLEAYADQIYMLGYLLTISAIGGVLFRLLLPVFAGGTLEKAVSSASLFSIGGVKLITTIFGLLVMFVFKEAASQWTECDDAQRKSDFEQQMERIRQASEKMITHAELATDRVQKLAEAFSAELVEGLGKRMEDFSKSVAEGTRVIGDFSERTSATAESQSELKTALGELKTAASQLQGGFTGLKDDSVAGLKKGLEELAEKFHDVRDLFSESWFKDIKQQFGQLQEACNQSVLTWKTFEQETAGLVNQSLKDLAEQINGTTSSARKMGSSFAKLCNEQFPAFTQEMQQIGEGAANTRKYVVDSVSAMAKAAESLKELSGILTTVTSQSVSVSEIGSDLQKLKDGTVHLRRNVQEGLDAVAGITSSLRSFNDALAKLKDNSNGFPDSLAQLQLTVGQANNAFGGLNGRLGHFAKGLDEAIISARSMGPKPTGTTPAGSYQDPKNSQVARPQPAVPTARPPVSSSPPQVSSTPVLPTAERARPESASRPQPPVATTTPAGWTPSHLNAGPPPAPVRPPTARQQSGLLGMFTRLFRRK